MLSELQVRPVMSLVSDVIRHEDNEKWLTKKKVEIVTTKNVEKTIKRQLVLEDGRVLDEDVPIVTLDTTENKEIFETDHDETRDSLDYNKRRETNIGDKVTTLKTTKDVKENVTKTEASQNMGSIANRDIAVVLRDKNRLSKVLRAQRPHSSYNSYEMAVTPIPVVVEASRSHKRVTDTQRVNERSVMRGGRVVSERVRREEHEEYESGQSETSDEGEDFERVEYEELRELEPREYKTKTEESFIEYFQKGKKMNKEPSMVRVGEGSHLRSESKQYRNIATSSVPDPRRQLHQSRSWDNDREDKLSKVKSLSRHQSNSLGDLSRNSSERVFIAKVIDETPTVKLRNKKKQDVNRHIEHRQSAQVTSSSQTGPRPSSRNTTPASREYRFPNCRVRDQRRERPMSLDITNNFYPGAESANKRLEEQSRTAGLQQSYSTLQRQRNYHSSLDVSREPKQIEITIESPSYKLVPKHHHSSSDNLLSAGSRAERQAVVTKSLVKKGGKFQSVGDICFTTSKEIPSPSREIAIQRDGDVTMTTPRRNTNDRRKSRREEAELIFTSEKQHRTLARRSLEPAFKASSCTNLSTRVIPIEFSGFPMSRSGSPATKYRTRVAVHGLA